MSQDRAESRFPQGAPGLLMALAFLSGCCALAYDNPPQQREQRLPRHPRPIARAGVEDPAGGSGRAQHQRRAVLNVLGHARHLGADDEKVEDPLHRKVVAAEPVCGQDRHQKRQRANDVDSPLKTFCATLSIPKKIAAGRITQ